MGTDAQVVSHHEGDRAGVGQREDVSSDVEEVPADVVRVRVDHEIVPAVPAPVLAQGPIPDRDIKEGTARHPEPVKVRVHPQDAVPVPWPEGREAAVRERPIDVEPRIVSPLVAEPLVVIDVRRVIHMPGRQMLCLSRSVGIASRLRSGRDDALVRPRRIGSRRMTAVVGVALR